MHGNLCSNAVTATTFGVKNLPKHRIPAHKRMAHHDFWSFPPNKQENQHCQKNQRHKGCLDYAHIYADLDVNYTNIPRCLRWKDYSGGRNRGTFRSKTGFSDLIGLT